MAPKARLASPRTRHSYRGLTFFSVRSQLPVRTSWASAVTLKRTPSGGIYPAVPSKCQQRAFYGQVGGVTSWNAESVAVESN